jgi:hypothetical protein
MLDVSYIGGFENFCFVPIARNEAQFVECTEFALSGLGQ